MGFTTRVALRWLDRLVTWLLLSFLHIASVLLPYVGHFAKRRVIKECILGTSLLSHTLTRVLQLLALIAISDHLLLFPLERIREALRIERTLHGDFLELHNIWPIDKRNVLTGLACIAIPLSFLSCSDSVVRFPFLCAFVHLFHLFIDDGEDRVGFKLHGTWAHASFHGARGARPLVIAVTFRATVALIVWHYKAGLRLLCRGRCILVEYHCGFLLWWVGVIKIHGAASHHICISKLFLRQRAMLCRFMASILCGTSCCRMLLLAWLLLINLRLVVSDSFL